MKKFIALLMVVVSLFSVMSVSAYAADESENIVLVTVNETDFIFNEDTTEDFRNKAISHHFSQGDKDATTYGLMCTLFGHKLESSIITTITHKDKATDPRCLRERYDTEACTRCDYTNAVLLSASYISCCA